MSEFVFGTWYPIESAPKDGTRILVSFGIMGVREVTWTEPVSSDWETWCVDDNKHGPFPLRGYSYDNQTSPTRWMPLPPPPSHEREGE